MTQAGRQAPYQDGIPVVQNSTDRALRFPNPVTDQRVHNLTSGAIERWTAGGWSADLIAPRVFDVKVYGATGDGTTDDTAAIQAALTAAALVGGVVFCPAANYAYSAQIVVPKNVVLRGVGMGSSTSIPSTRFTALASFPVSTPHFVLGSTTALSFGARIEDCRIVCSNITGSIGISAPNIQENSGLKRVLVQNYLTTGILISEIGGGLFADNYSLEDIQCWASASAVNSVGIDVLTSRRDGVIRKASIIATSGQNAGVRIQSANGVDGGPVCYDLHVEGHTDALQVSTNGSCRAYHISNGVNGTNVVNISSSRDCVLVDVHLGAGTTAIANSILGENITTARVAYYHAADTGEGYQVFHSAGSSSTHGNVMASSAPRWMVKSTATAGAAMRGLYSFRDGNNNGWDVRYGADGSGRPLQFMPVTSGTPGSTMLQVDNLGRLSALQTSNGPVGTLTLGAAATTAVSNSGVTANSIILLFPTNAAAATLVSGASSPYISAKSAGVSFTVATANAAAAAGTETFNYLVLN